MSRAAYDWSFVQSYYESFLPMDLSPRMTPLQYFGRLEWSALRPFDVNDPKWQRRQMMFRSLWQTEESEPDAHLPELIRALPRWMPNVAK